ncbi:MAG: trehalose-phosphatase [candidate division Zixibacteria bacterium]|nr:trehalose-phosphatase [candidate division Zixibacteria bacterium]
MQILNSELKYEEFLANLRDASNKALILDYDGTLAPFRKNPSEAYPYEGIPELLNPIIEMPDTRVVIISGRWTKDLIPLLKLKNQPEIWGTHGIERLKPDGTYHTAELDERALQALARVDEWCEANGLENKCEKKPGSLAIHWRGLDDSRIKDIKNKVDLILPNIPDSSRLDLHKFDGGVELRIPSRDKGDAVTTIMNEMPEGTPGVYMGDDLTDEDAFKAIKKWGIGILVRKEFRATAADVWIKPPDEVKDFLKSWS